MRKVPSLSLKRILILFLSFSQRYIKVQGYKELASMDPEFARQQIAIANQQYKQQVDLLGDSCRLTYIATTAANAGSHMSDENVDG